MRIELDLASAILVWVKNQEIEDFGNLLPAQLMKMNSPKAHVI